MRRFFALSSLLLANFACPAWRRAHVVYPAVATPANLDDLAGLPQRLCPAETEVYCDRAYPGQGEVTAARGHLPCVSGG